MSDAPRMPLPRASAAATLLLELWGMNNPDCMVAGSVRRKAAFVGDLDLIAPIPQGPKDPLFDRIDATVARERALFGSDSDVPPFTEVIAGLKPHFKAANLRVQLRIVVDGVADTPIVLPVQVCRYTPENRGWMEIMKTGPRDFNVWLLFKWKERFGIAMGPQADAKDEWAGGGGTAGTHALIANHLVDVHGVVVPMSTEKGVFDRCGVQYVEPADRDAFMNQRRSTATRDRRESMR